MILKKKAVNYCFVFSVENKLIENHNLDAVVARANFFSFLNLLLKAQTQGTRMQNINVVMKKCNIDTATLSNLPVTTILFWNCTRQKGNMNYSARKRYPLHSKAEELMIRCRNHNISWPQYRVVTLLWSMVTPVQYISWKLFLSFIKYPWLKATKKKINK